MKHKRAGLIAAVLVLSSCCQWSVNRSASTPWHKLEAADVLIYALGSDGDYQGSGTVVGKTKDGYPAVLTVAHLFHGETLGIIVVAPKDGNPMAGGVPGKLEALDEVHDLALVTIRGTLDRSPLRLSRTEPQTFDQLFLLHSPGGGPHTAGNAIMSAKGRIGHSPEVPLYQMTGFCWPGSSGGTVANASGELVGVIKSVSSDDNGTLISELCFAVPLPLIKRFLHKQHVSLVTA